MRDRLLVAFATLVVAVVAVLLVERGYATSALVHESEQRSVERSAEVAAAVLSGPRTEVTPDLLARVAAEGERVVYVDGAGDRVEATGAPGRAADDEGPSATRPVPGGGTVTVTREAATVDERVAESLLPLVLIALGLVGAAVGVAVWLARRLVRPFGDLAEAAGRIGRGDYDVDIPRSNVPEADAVARSLRATAADLDGLVRREREFAVHASHELRTPLTAARLELEDLALSPRTPPDVVARVAAATGQLDRLGATVAAMLDATRESRTGTNVDIDLAALLRDTVAEWGRLVRGREVVAVVDGVVAVRLPVGSLMQVMDVLIGNAVTHGEGTITATAVQTPAYVEVRVADEGPHDRAVEGAKVAGASGGGSLASATRTVEALGGHLRLTDAPRTTFSVVLPRSPRETSSS